MRRSEAPARPQKRHGTRSGMMQSSPRGICVMPINRRRVLAATAGLCLSGTAGAATEAEPRLIREDYALARQRFQTDLLERGPAPDPAQPLSPPPGANRIRYRSGTLDLV